jgi:hypothetical protein
MRTAFAVSVITLWIAVTASAQNNRSFVATYGSDANDCTAGHECRSFSRALSVTNYGGEVLALTSGGYGPFTVTQAVSVIATTGAASITAPNGTNAVEVSGFGGDRVLLRGLTITISGTSGTGVFATGYGLLSIENCTLSGGGAGVIISGDSLSQATITDTAALATASAGFSCFSRVVLVRCRAEKNGAGGIEVGGSAGGVGRVTATEFISNGNLIGARVLSFTSGQYPSLDLDRSVLSNNTNDGVFCNAGGGGVAYVFIGNCVVTNNGIHGLNPSTAGTMWSLKNNLVANNSGGDIGGTAGVNALPGQ